MASSSVNSGETSNSTGKKTKLSERLSTVAGELVSFFNEFFSSMIKELTPRMYVAVISEVLDDNKYNVRLIDASNEPVVIHSITNNSRYDLRVGDYVEILSSSNNISTGFIVNRIYSAVPTYMPIQKDDAIAPPTLSSALKTSADTIFETSESKALIMQPGPPTPPGD